jgi:hypothetical protein
LDPDRFVMISVIRLFFTLFVRSEAAGSRA